MTKNELEQQVKLFKQGDNLAFNKVYDNTYKLLYMIIYGIVRNKSASEDLLQDTYRTAIQNIDKYNNSNFIAWITTIGRNLALNYYNKNKRVEVCDFNDSQNLSKLTYETQTEDGLFIKAKELLSEEDYKILVMIVVSGYKRREIAKMMDMPVSTVSHRYKMALLKIKNTLKEVKE